MPKAGVGQSAWYKRGRVRAVACRMVDQHFVLAQDDALRIPENGVQ